ncbi:MAG: LysM peptidoglycan-binding domain-containing protein [Ardenticatenaceae bacterium]|nr:LysM peptidoglycan-binding domain-containing protein [Ardenticatenaceae bacterium]
MRSYLILTILCLLLVPLAVQAQTETPTPPETGTDSAAEATADSVAIPFVHTVQEGENLTYIAQTYGITVEELLVVNSLSEDAILFVGQTLIIPGGEGEAVATVYTVQPGDTLYDVADAFNTDVSAVLGSNHMIAPEYDLHSGQTLAVVSRTGSALPQTINGRPHIVAPGESLLQIAAAYGLSPRTISNANGLPYPTYLYPGQRLRIPLGDAPYRHLPGEWVDVQIRPLPIVQGQTVSIYVENLLDGLPNGELAGQALHFVPSGDGFTALIGLDAFTAPGAYTLTLSGSSSDRPWTPFRTDLDVLSGGYGVQYITVPEELNALLDPTIRQNEDTYLATIYTNYREEQDWQGLFQVPLTVTIVTAPYGDSRSYNGGPFDIFHTGVDFGANAGTPVYASAPGNVVYSGALELRGNAVIIDHGRGVMTAYFHLTESFVTVGEAVSAGQLIATVGSTGLSSGPHLHWDLRILNVPVNGLQWTTTVFP